MPAYLENIGGYNISYIKPMKKFALMIAGKFIDLVCKRILTYDKEESTNFKCNKCSE